jgi:hypothetical protein
VIRLVVVGIVMFGAAFTFEATQRSAPAPARRIAMNMREERRTHCFFYRFIDRPDSAYFEVSCRKPLPDSIVLLPRRVP